MFGAAGGRGGDAVSAARPRISGNLFFAWLKWTRRVQGGASNTVERGHARPGTLTPALSQRERGNGELLRGRWSFAIWLWMVEWAGSRAVMQRLHKLHILGGEVFAVSDGCTGCCVRFIAKWKNGGEYAWSPGAARPGVPAGSSRDREVTVRRENVVVWSLKGRYMPRPVAQCRPAGPHGAIGCRVTLTWRSGLFPCGPPGLKRGFAAHTNRLRSSRKWNESRTAGRSTRRVDRERAVRRKGLAGWELRRSLARRGAGKNWAALNLAEANSFHEGRPLGHGEYALPQAQSCSRGRSLGKCVPRQSLGTSPLTPDPWPLTSDPWPLTPNLWPLTSGSLRNWQPHFLE